MWNFDEKTATLVTDLLTECQGLDEDDWNTVTAVATLLSKRIGERARLRIESQLKILENEGHKFRETDRIYNRENVDSETIVLREAANSPFKGFMIDFRTRYSDRLSVWLDVTAIDGRTYEDVFVRDWLNESCDGPQNVVLPLTTENLLECASHYEDRNGIAEMFEDLAQQIRGLPRPEGG